MRKFLHVLLEVDILARLYLKLDFEDLVKSTLHIFLLSFEVPLVDSDVVDLFEYVVIWLIHVRGDLLLRHT